MDSQPIRPISLHRDVTQAGPGLDPAARPSRDPATRPKPHRKYAFRARKGGNASSSPFPPATAAQPAGLSPSPSLPSLLHHHLGLAANAADVPHPLLPPSSASPSPYPGKFHSPPIPLRRALPSLLALARSLDRTEPNLWALPQCWISSRLSGGVFACYPLVLALYGCSSPS